jgi:hypothetical protein
VDLVQSKRGSAIWLQENKTRGDIKEGKIVQQLNFDLQTLLYVVALQKMQEVARGGQVL